MADPRGTGPTAWVFGVVAVLVVLAALHRPTVGQQDVAFNFVTGRLDGGERARRGLDRR
ncbi:MAG: hypothetical protein H6732_14225 [Alphaproteobacteria bacterium]|nr:hypothetical protein [Alphaproteobacteria bacterium]